jgi:phenolic acid decarboxylase
MLSVNAYVFQPSSDIASVFYFDSFDPNPDLIDFKISSGITVTGYWLNGQETTPHNFTPGVYTVVGGDEWGALAVLHFVVQGNDESTPAS